MIVNIVNRHTHTPLTNDVYVGRGTPLGNPEVATGPDDRDRVCDLYEEYLMKMLRAGDLRIVRELKRIATVAKNHEGEVNLVCSCAPRRCHAESIKKILPYFEVTNE